MRIEYSLTEQDFKDAFKTHRNAKLWTRWVYRIGYVIFGIVILEFVLLMLFPQGKSISEVITNIAPLGILAILWAVCLDLFPRHSVVKQFREQPSAKGLKTLITDEFGISIEGDGIHIQIGWSNYVRWVESKNVILLYTQPMAFQMLPKRIFTEAQLQEFRELLRTKVVVK